MLFIIPVAVGVIFKLHRGLGVHADSPKFSLQYFQ